MQKRSPLSVVGEGLDYFFFALLLVACTTFFNSAFCIFCLTRCFTIFVISAYGIGLSYGNCIDPFPVLYGDKSFLKDSSFVGAG